MFFKDEKNLNFLFLSSGPGSSPLGVASSPDLFLSQTGLIGSPFAAAHGAAHGYLPPPGLLGYSPAMEKLLLPPPAAASPPTLTPASSTAAPNSSDSSDSEEPIDVVRSAFQQVKSSVSPTRTQVRTPRKSPPVKSVSDSKSSSPVLPEGTTNSAPAKTVWRPY